MSEERTTQVPRSGRRSRSRPGGNWAAIETRVATGAWAAARVESGPCHRRGSSPGDLVGAGSGGSAWHAASPRGGYFRETYRSHLTIETEAGRRPLMTTILFLLTASEPAGFTACASTSCGCTTPVPRPSWWCWARALRNTMWSV